MGGPGSAGWLAAALLTLLAAEAHAQKCRSHEYPNPDAMREAQARREALRDSIVAKARRDGVSNPRAVILARHRDDGTLDLKVLNSNLPQSVASGLSEAASLFLGTPGANNDLRLELDAPRLVLKGDRWEHCRAELADPGGFQREIRRLVARHPDSEGWKSRTRQEANLLLYVDHRGEVAYVELTEESGDEWVDRGLVSLARSLDYSPARLEGVATGAWVSQQVRF